MSLSNVFSIIVVINILLLEVVFEISIKIPTFWLLLIGTFFLIMPIILTLNSLFRLNRSLEMKSWPKVQGRISSVDLDGGVLSLITGVKFKLVYDYYVKDRLHSNDQFNPMKTTVKLKDLFYVQQLRKKSVNELEGVSINVFFNPENTWDSIICNKVYVDSASLLIPSTNALIIAGYLFYCIY